MPKQTNLEQVQEINKAWFQALREGKHSSPLIYNATKKAADQVEFLAEQRDFLESAVPSTVGELLTVLLRAKHLEVQTGAIKAAPAPEKPTPSPEELLAAIDQVAQDLGEVTGVPMPKAHLTLLRLAVCAAPALAGVSK